MIVNYDEHGWRIITQRCHGLLAGQICAHWASVDRQERWAEILIATTEHDDVFNEFERNPLIDHNGSPLNYKMMGFDEGASKRLINMALTKSRLIALLISRHISFTHGKEASAKSFLNRLTKKELHWLREAGIKKADADSAYNQGPIRI